MRSKRMRGFLISGLLLALGSLAGSSNPGPLVSRRGFQQRLKQIARSFDLLPDDPDPDYVPKGMPAARVLRILGPPDEVRAAGPVDGKPMQIWCYGVVSPGGFPTLGSVTISEEGFAAYVRGGRDMVPAPPTVPEGKLRRLLDLLARVPEPEDRGQADPLTLIQAVNELQPLGKERALEVIREYVRLNIRHRSLVEAYNYGPYGLYPLMCLLFSVDPKDAEHFLTPAIHVQDDVPLSLIWSGGGSPGILFGYEELENFSRFGKLRAKPLSPPRRPWEILAQLEATDFRRETYYSRPQFLKDMAGQLLRLLRPVYRTPLDKQGLQLPPDEKFNEWWDGIVADLGKLNLRWDARRNSYVFADGSQLPKEVLPEHRGPFR
ncbi:MAG TPA: hypothetical protein VK689_14660 [Armatimonadota bacterium]|nr:hypothetical protein [Armatimonadota bacterium]